MPRQDHLRGAPDLQDVLRDISFSELVALAQSRARAAYRVGDRRLQGLCIVEHLTSTQRGDLQRADCYECPTCGRLLKDRAQAGLTTHAQ